jgi:opacity protein-like surface antigen
MAVVTALAARNARAADDDAVEGGDASAGEDESSDGDQRAEDDAEETDAEKDEDGKGKKQEFGHQGQLGLRAGLVGGYRMVFSYDNSPYCAAPDPGVPFDEQQKFCGHAAPLAIDTGLSFALLDWLEPFIGGRFGLSPESQTDTEALLAILAGLRVYTMSDSQFKIFVEPAIGLSFESGRGSAGYQITYSGDAPNYATDLLFHFAAGPQFDFTRNISLYADAGLTLGIVRSLSATLEVAGGLQLRGP